MKIHDVIQGSPDWLLARLGKVTASQAENLISPTFKIRDGEMPKTFLHKKLAEVWRGEPMEQYEGGWETEHGVMREEEARRFFCFTYDQFNLKNVGFIETDDQRAGCSPDGLLDEDNGLELKSPATPHTHVRYLVNGVLPPEYAVQVHFSMFVTGRPKWTFCSYFRKFPTFVLTVERNVAIMATIGTALETFYASFDTAMAKLKEMAA